MVSHPFLTGNFSPVKDEHELTTCSFTGSIPKELWGGQYIRNGSNPSHLQENEQRYHWFDGDGMLSGVWFKRKGNLVEPCFVNKYLVTDVLLAERSYGSTLLPSITTLISPMCNPIYVIFDVVKAALLCLKYRVFRLSVANTSIIYHNSTVLATCESGPFLQVELPSLETIGWCEYTITPAGKEVRKLSIFEEWATGHPRVDPITSELIFFGCSFLPPYIRYSVIPPDCSKRSLPSFLVEPISIKSPKLMHDFGVSLKHTVILDLPLTMNPLNVLKRNPSINFSSKSKSRFGIFPRHTPKQIRWFESEACVIFHTANTWSEIDGEIEFVNMLVCRFKTPKLMYLAGNIPAPAPTPDEGICHLFYYRFNLSSPDSEPSSAFALSSIPFEFPSMSYAFSMQYARYMYGCTLRQGSFDLSLGGVAKVDCLARLDVKHLIDKGRNGEMKDGMVDKRSVQDIIEDNRLNPDDPIKVFVFDEHHYGQECSFVPKTNPQHEADGYLLTYVFDERQLRSDGRPSENAVSELWIIDAANMSVVVGKVRLPQRVPYGFHGDFIPEKKILAQKLRADKHHHTLGEPRSAFQVVVQSVYLIEGGFKLLWCIIYNMMWQCVG